MESALSGVDVLLLDIEGTVCPISFVKDVLFPYAQDALPQYLDKQWDDPSFIKYREAFPPSCHSDRNAFGDHFKDLVARDVKFPPLKGLQGDIWKDGYDAGALKAPLFVDVPPFLTNAYAAGKKIMIYSSGSVPAQKLFFAHTDAHPSDMSVLISDWFDTVNAGPKTEVASYAAILSRHSNINSARWLFLSDNLDEVNAARRAGMRSIAVTRPGNAPLAPDHPCSEFAISEFTPESVGKALSSIATE